MSDIDRISLEWLRIEDHIVIRLLGDDGRGGYVISEIRIPVSELQEQKIDE